ncbi:ABC transporter permease [Oscillibacter sp. MSJ-2]|uniref:ABC transporter permease n=1 Tax=Dysosmobacter acutus TaxID=2841504 RepID=A0ABS6F6T1_9FIRM|nr:ABC transporter permease [Dysosmobacter acutus]MBU5625998.1 ABC transporter permease [Dysosmobacter acutus]
MNRRKTQHYLFWGVTLTGVLLALFVIGYFWTPYDPAAMNGTEKNLAPSLRHLFGTDLFGRDIFSRVLKGGGTTLFVALCALAIGGGVGVTLGAFTGYFGGWLDRGLMRLNDVITAFPSILLALVLISVLGPGKINLILALGIVFIPSYARMSRSAFAACRDKNYVISARLMGAHSGRILLRHILPNTGAVLLPAVTIGFNNVVLAEASMSYLGIGITLPDTSLGYMLSDSQQYLSASPWYALCTGGTIVLLILGVGLIGEGLQRRGREG